MWQTVEAPHQNRRKPGAGGANRQEMGGFIGIDVENAMTVESACWLAAEVHASAHTSASCYCGPEDVRVLTVVESELKLIEVQREIFRGNIVIGAKNPALQERPESFDAVGMNQPAHIFPAAMADYFMRQSIGSVAQQPIAGMLIRRNEFNALTDGLADKAIQRRGIGVLSIMRQTTLPLRAIAPMTAVLPAVPGPPNPGGFFPPCRFLALPPM